MDSANKKIIVVKDKKYSITEYKNTRVFSWRGRMDDINRIKYDFEYMDKEIPEIDVIKRCILLGCYGFSRNSLHEFKGKNYIKPPTKTPDILKKNLKYDPKINTVTFIIEEIKI
jgi:hypothetical protein